MRSLGDWTLSHTDDHGVDLALEGGHVMRLSALEDDLIRVSILRGGAWQLPRSWAVDPTQSSALEGRERGDLTGFTCPSVTLDQREDSLALSTKRLRVTVTHPLALKWEVMHQGDWHPLAEDRPTGAYALGRCDGRLAHYQLREAGDRVYGLGEKSGLLERSNRRYEMRNLDAMGYDAARTDPLYKHVPFTMTMRDGAGCFGLFYDNFATTWFDLGNEMDNYHRPYRIWRAEDGDLDYYLSWSPDLLGLIKRQVRLTGGTAFPPRWSLGYSGSTMAYTDAPDAEAQLSGFLDKCAEHELPCDSFHLSSGYTSIGAKRYVFHWNPDKFPQPARLGQRFNDAGVRLIANIKPVLLRDHPLRAEAEPLFIRDSDTGEPEESPFWDDEGSHLDFTNPATIDWWQDNLRRQLLDQGITASWNDNNEFEVWDHDARCAGFGTPIAIGMMRPIMALLMTQASRDAQIAYDPTRRPYVITRSGGSGIQRLAQTWTGDNRTGWDSLRWNIRMGLGLSLSGFFNIGHDVGGFAGPRPDAELLLRWVQNGIFHPRFVIHSWNEDGSVTEPWTHPQVLPQIKAAFALRYRLLPYLYTCLWRAVSEDEPILRPTFLNHPDDPACYADTDDFMLGRDLLVASVVEPGADRRRVYLPRNATGWRDFWSGEWHEGGTTLDLPVTAEAIPLFVRAGAILPLSCGASSADPDGEAARELAIYPARGAFQEDALIYDDDGDSARAEAGDHCLTRLSLRGDDKALHLSLALSGNRPPPHGALTCCVIGDARPLRADGLTGNQIRWRPT